MAKVGMRIKLIKMHDDPRPVDEGMEGTINHIDSLGTLHTTWDDGRYLGVVPGQDEYVLYPSKEDTITDIDRIFNESVGSDSSSINKSMPKQTLRGANKTTAGSNVNKTFKSSLSNTKPKVRDIKIEDELKGGIADKLSIKDLAKKHKVSIDVINKEVELGIPIEMEHTDSRKRAREVAMDHIAEFPDFYSNKKFGAIASEKGLERVNEGNLLENIFNFGFGKKDTDAKYDNMKFVKDLKKVANTIKTSKPQHEETVKKLIEKFRDKYVDHSMIGDVMKSLYYELDAVGNELEETGTAGGVSTGSFVGPLNGPKQESTIIKYSDFINEISDTKLTRLRDSDYGFDTNPWVGDKKGDGWIFNDKPAWVGGKIIDILAKLNINWKDDDLTVKGKGKKSKLKETTKTNSDRTTGSDQLTGHAWADKNKDGWYFNDTPIWEDGKIVDILADIETDWTDINLSVTEVVDKAKSHRRQNRKDRHTMYSVVTDKDLPKEEELDETTTFGDVWGVDGPPVTPTFAAGDKHMPSKKPIWKGGTIVQKIKGGGVMTEENTIKWVKGGKFVKIKDKCAKYKNNEHCSQGAIDDPLELSDTVFKTVSEVAKKMGISENDVMSKIRAKLKGVSKEQVDYNRKHKIPLDWNGTKEGYYEYIENRKNYSGSN